MEEALKLFSGYGALGMVCLVSMLMTRRIYLDMRAAEKEHQAAQKALTERYVAQSMTIIDKGGVVEAHGHELMKFAIDLLEKKSK